MILVSFSNIAYTRRHTSALCNWLMLPHQTRRINEQRPSRVVGGWGKKSGFERKESERDETGNDEQVENESMWKGVNMSHGHDASYSYAQNLCTLRSFLAHLPPKQGHSS
jgi:hypothetical protein